MKRFLIRDKETKEVMTGWDEVLTLDFKDLSAAKTFYSSIPFGVNLYYEIYDSEKDEVVVEAVNTAQRWKRKR